MKRISVALAAVLSLVFVGCASDFEAGQAAFREKDWEGAIIRLEKVQASDEGYTKANALLATCYYEFGVDLHNKKSWRRSIDVLMKVEDSSKYAEQSRRYISEATEALAKAELEKLHSRKDIAGLDRYIQSHEGTPFADDARNAKQELLEFFLRKQRVYEVRQKDFDNRYDATSNDVKKSLVFNEANKWSTDYMRPDRYRFKHWEGRLVYVSTEKGGDQASVKIDSRTTSYKADVPSSSKAYGSFLEVEEGNVVLFSGEFIVKEGILSEYSWTEGGRMDNPGFNIHLTDISLKHR